MAIMIDFSCIYNDSDEDCYKCAKKGYIFTCRGCEYYEVESIIQTPISYGNHKRVEDEENSNK